MKRKIIIFFGIIFIVVISLFMVSQTSWAKKMYSKPACVWEEGNGTTELDKLRHDSVSYTGDIDTDYEFLILDVIEIKGSATVYFYDCPIRNYDISKDIDTVKRELKEIKHFTISEKKQYREEVKIDKVNNYVVVVSIDNDESEITYSEGSESYYNNWNHYIGRYLPW